jgi:hypothetical protein
MAIGSLVGMASHGLFAPAGGSCDYPAEDDVRDGVVYADAALTGNLILPDEDEVELGVGYGANGTEFEGSLECEAPVDPSVAGTMPFAVISSRIVARVAQALGTTVDWVRPVASADYAVTEMENLFAYCQFFGISPTDPTTGRSFGDDGAGRWRRVIGRRCRIYIYVRSGVDVYGGDEVALQGNDPGQVVTTPPVMPGIFVLEELVANALDNWTPTYTDDLDVVRPLTISPVHILDSTDGPPVRKPENEAGLVRSHIDVQVCYTLAIQRVEPAPAGLPTPLPGN